MTPVETWPQHLEIESTALGAGNIPSAKISRHAVPLAKHRTSAHDEFRYLSQP
jgi:hypothetical protein